MGTHKGQPEHITTPSPLLGVTGDIKEPVLNTLGKLPPILSCVWVESIQQWKECHGWLIIALRDFLVVRHFCIIPWLYKLQGQYLFDNIMQLTGSSSCEQSSMQILQLMA